MLRLALSVGCAALVLIAAGSASAATLRVDARMRAGMDGPTPDQRFMLLGEVTGLGMQGGIVMRKTMNLSKASGRFTYYDGTGSISGTAASEVTKIENDVATVVEQLVVTGGTGRYAGAKGSLAAEGTGHMKTGLHDQRIRGSVEIDGAPAPDPKRTPRRHPFRATVLGQAAFVQGNVATLVGSVRGMTPGGGVMLLDAPQGTKNTVIRYEYFDGRGAIRGRFPITRTPRPDGTVAITARGAGSVSGAGAYRGLRSVGRTSFTGSRNPNTGRVTIKLAGAFLY